MSNCEYGKNLNQDIDRCPYFERYNSIFSRGTCSRDNLECPWNGRHVFCYKMNTVSTENNLFLNNDVSVKSFSCCDCNGRMKLIEKRVTVELDNGTFTETNLKIYRCSSCGASIYHPLSLINDLFLKFETNNNKISNNS